MRAWATAAVLAASCGAPATSPTMSYCDVTRAIVTSGSEVRAGSDANAPDPAEEARGELARLRTLLGQWPGLAGPEARADVAVVAAERLRFLDVLEGRASMAPPDPAANQRVSAYTQRRCGFGLPQL